MSAPLAAEHRQRGRDAVQHAAQLTSIIASQQSMSSSATRPGPGELGVTHEDVKAFEPPDRRGDQLLEVRAPGDIHGQHLRGRPGVDSFDQC